MLADRFNGGDCYLHDGAVKPQHRSQLEAASARLLHILEYRRSLYAPDDLTLLVRLSALAWSKLVEQQQLSARECEHWRGRAHHAMQQLHARDKRIRELEGAERQRAAKLRTLEARVARLESTGGDSADGDAAGGDAVGADGEAA